MTRSSKAGSVSTSGSESGISSSISRAAGPRLSSAIGHRFVQRDRLPANRERTGLNATHVEQVVDEPVQPVERLVGGGEQLCLLGVGPRHVGAAQPGHRRLRRRERRAQVVADGVQQRRAHAVSLFERPGGFGRRRQSLLFDGGHGLRCESAENTKVGCRHRASARSQREAFSNRHFGVSLSWGLAGLRPDGRDDGPSLVNAVGRALPFQQSDGRELERLAHLLEKCRYPGLARARRCPPRWPASRTQPMLGRPATYGVRQVRQQSSPSQRR